MKLIFLAALIAVSALAQTPDLPQNHVAVMGFYDPNANPAGSVSGAYAHRVGDTTYSYSLADVTFQPFIDRSVKGISRNITQPKISTTSGLAQMITSQLGYNVFVVGAIGVQSTPGGGTAAGFSATGGVLLVRPLKAGWTLDIPVRIIAGTGPPQYVFGIGLGFGR